MPAALHHHVVRDVIEEEPEVDQDDPAHVHGAALRVSDPPRHLVR